MQENFSPIIKPQISLGRLFFPASIYLCRMYTWQWSNFVKLIREQHPYVSFLGGQCPCRPFAERINSQNFRSSLKRSPRVDNFVQNHYRSFILTLKPRHLVSSVNQLWIHRTSFLTDLKKQEVEQVLSQCNTITNWLTAKNFYTQYHWIRVYMFDIICGRSFDNISCYRPQTKFRARSYFFRCSSVHRGWVSVWYHFLCGSLVPCSFLGGLPTGEGICFQGVSIQWGLPQGSLPPGDPCLQGNPPGIRKVRAVCILLGMLSCLARIFAGWKFGHLQQEWIHGNTGSTFLWKILVNLTCI